MAVVIDTLLGKPGAPRHPEKAHRPDQPSLRKPDWIRVKAPVSPGYVETRAHRARQRPAHGVRGGRLPQYRRVLGEEARHLHDHGRHLHAGLRLLQRQDRAARRARSRRARPCRRGHGKTRAIRTSSSPRSIATIFADGGAAHFAAVIRAIRARCPQTTIEVLTPDFLRKDGAAEIVVAARPDVFNHNLETVPSKYLTVRPGARYFASIRLLQQVKELDREHVHQIRDHGRARRGAQRSAPGDGRSARRRRRFPHHRAISAADAQASPGAALRAARRIRGAGDDRLCQGFLRWCRRAR